jgi:hypothetical protein
VSIWCSPLGTENRWRITQSWFIPAIPCESPSRCVGLRISEPKQRNRPQRCKSSIRYRAAWLAVNDKSGVAGWVSFSKLRLFLKARSGTRIGNVRWKPSGNPRLSLDPKISPPRSLCRAGRMKSGKLLYSNMHDALFHWAINGTDVDLAASLGRRLSALVLTLVSSAATLPSPLDPRLF